MSFILSSQKNPHLKCIQVTNSEVSKCLQLTFKWHSAEEYICMCKNIYNLRKYKKVSMAKYIQSIFLNTSVKNFKVKN